MELGRVKPPFDEFSSAFADKIVRPMRAVLEVFELLETKPYVLTRAKHVFEQAYNIIAEHAELDGLMVAFADVPHSWADAYWNTIQLAGKGNFIRIN